MTENATTAPAPRTSRSLWASRTARRAAVVAGLVTAIGLGGAAAGLAPAHAAPTATTTTTGAPAPAPVGLNFHGMWSFYTDAQRMAVLDQFAAAGVSSVRLDVSWKMLQPAGPGSYDAWGVKFVDKVVAMANQRGIKPLMMLWLTPGWANGNAGERALPTDPAHYARVAGWAAARWQGKVVGWEVWNEPNSPAFMTGADPVAYAKLLRAAYPAIKAADPGTTVVTGGVEYNDTPWLTRLYDAGITGSFDALGTHPYQGVADAEPATPDSGTKWTFTHAAAVHRLMTARGDGHKKIWFTEFGWSTHANTYATANWNRGVTEAVQSDYLVRSAALVAATMPYVERLYWYADRETNTGNAQYDGYGVLRYDLTPKPVLTGLRTSNDAANASTGISIQSTTSSTALRNG